MKNKKLVMIPGPTPVARSIQDQMGRETVAFLDPAFVKDFKELVQDLKEMWNTSGECFVVAGTGTLAMEMAIANTTKRGDNALVISHGYFGDRYAEMCERRELHVDRLASEWGRTVALEDIEKQLREKSYAVMTVTHVDTSTGTKAPLEDISKIAAAYPETLLIVDGVCSTAAEKEDIDGMGIDVLLTGSQKAFGVAPGLAVVWAGKKALQRRKSLGTIPDSYMDFEKWIPVMNDPGKYWGTPAVNLVWAFKEAVKMIKEEGLEQRFKRHQANGKAIQASLESLGFKILAESGYRASTLSDVLYPVGMDDALFRKTLAEEGVVVAGGLGAYAGKLFRLGHMGNIDSHIIVSVLAAIERTLIKLEFPFEHGISVKTFLESQG